MAPTTHPDSITIVCDTCEKRHVATYSHDSQWGDHHAVFAATCDQDWLTDWYTQEAAV